MAVNLHVAPNNHISSVQVTHHEHGLESAARSTTRIPGSLSMMKSVDMIRVVLAALVSISCVPVRSNLVEPPSDLPRVRVQLHELSGGYATHKAFAEETSRKLEAALNSVEFRRAVVNRRFRHTLDRTSVQILQSILEAKEVYGPGGSDGVVDLRLRTITKEEDGQQWLKWCEPGSRMGTIGVDGDGTGVIATCPQHLDLWAREKDFASLSGHMMHEFMHVLGYGHPRPGKYKSAAYRIGDLATCAVKGDL